MGGTLDFDIGTGMFAETSTKVSSTSPMANFLALGAGDKTFEIHDSSGIISTVTYNRDQSLSDLRTNITASDPRLTAVLVSSGSVFQIEIVEQDREVLTFQADTDGLIAALNISNVGDAVFSANFAGAAGGGDDLSAVVSGRTITGLSLTGAEGLQVFYNGTVDLDAVQLDITTGFGERLYFAIDTMLTPVTGLMDTNVASLTKRNDVQQDRVDNMLARLELTRATLLPKYIAMEVALARSKNLRDTLTQTFDAMFASKA